MNRSFQQLTIDVPDAPVNTLSRETLAELNGIFGALEEMAQSGELKGVVLLSGKDSVLPTLRGLDSPFAFDGAPLGALSH